MNAFHYADAVVLAVRIVAIATILGMTAWFIVRPLLPKLRDEQVALYLEEHERSLKATRDHRRRDAEQRARREHAGCGRRRSSTG